MKRLPIGVAAVATTLALVSAPAFAANSHANDNATKKTTTTSGTVQVTGTIKGLDLAAGKLTVLAKTLPQNRSDFKKLKGTLLVFGTDTSTLIARNDTQTTFASLRVGDHVSIKAKYTLTVANNVTTWTWFALRISASGVVVTPTPSPTPTPTPVPDLSFKLGGVITGHTDTGTLLTVSVYSASFGKDLTLKANSVLGTAFTFSTDTATVIMRGTTSLTYAQLTALAFPAVNVTGTCTAGATPVCKATRIDVTLPS